MFFENHYHHELLICHRNDVHCKDEKLERRLEIEAKFVVKWYQFKRP